MGGACHGIVGMMIYTGGSFTFCQKLGIHIASNLDFHPALRWYVRNREVFYLYLLLCIAFCTYSSRISHLFSQEMMRYEEQNHMYEFRLCTKATPPSPDVSFVPVTLAFQLVISLWLSIQYDTQFPNLTRSKPT